VEIFDKFAESENIIIDGDNKIGKFTLALYLIKHKFNNITILTSVTKNKILKKIKSLKNSFEYFKDIEKMVNIFSFREDWVELKNEYGINFLLQDFEKFISETQNDVIFFYKLEYIFEYSDRDIIDYFYTELLSYGIKYKKKLVFTLNKNVVNYDLLTQYLIEDIDLYLKIYIQKDYRELEISFALTPIIDRKYVFIEENNKLSLFTKDTSGYLKKDISVVLIAQDKKIQKFHKYILDKEHIHLSIIDSIAPAMDSILKNPDFLIFYQNDIELSVCELSKKYDLYTKIMYLINEDFIRVDDRLKARDFGCIDLMNFNTQKMHYILELEKYMQLGFYKSDVIKDSKIIDKVDKFKNYINLLLKEKVLFTLLKVEGELNNDLKILRDYDKFIKVNNYNFLLIINLTKQEVANILFKKLTELVHIIEVQDSIDLYFGEKLCIE